MKRISALLAAAAICTLSVADASAQANLALRGIGLKAGVVNPEEVDATLGLGLIFDLGTVHPQWALESYAGWWSYSEEAYGVEAGVSDYSFGGTVKYLFETSNPTIQPFVGGGLGLHVYDMHAETPPVYFGGVLVYPGTSYDDTDVELGLDLGGGLRIDRGNQFAFMTDAWFTISDISQFSLMVGAIYMFGR
jgi:hypothetical protein